MMISQWDLRNISVELNVKQLVCQWQISLFSALGKAWLASTDSGSLFALRVQLECKDSKIRHNMSKQPEET